MNKDEQDLNLLAIFHYVLGGLTILGSSFFLIYVGMGIAILTGKFDAKNSPPDPMGWIFIVLGAILLVLGCTLGILMIVAGRKLSKHVSRIFCLVIAGIECIITPLGTILGIFTIIALTRESVINLFASSGNGHENVERG